MNYDYLHEHATESLLDALDVLREEVGILENEKAKIIIQELTVRRVYPEETKIGMTAEIMVSSYGSRWHIYKGMLNCPHCETDLRDQKLGTPFKREILIKEGEKHTYQCPDCGRRWKE